MKITVPYLDKKLPLEFPDENLLAIVEPAARKAGRSTKEIIENALANPCVKAGTAKTFKNFIKDASSLLIIINDATRPTPTGEILAILYPEIKKYGTGALKINLLVATGAHRAPTEDEYRQILGEMYGELRPFTIAHNSRDEDSLETLGRTRSGTPITLNKKLFEAERIIATGSVEPHYFAGWTGGRKAFLPGIAGIKTIEANHKNALSASSHSLALGGNPVHEDMMDALELIKAPVFALMTVLDSEQKTAAAFSGDIEASFYAAVESAKQIFCVKIPQKADIVVSVAKFPMDIDLYQSQKAIDNGSLALKDGGTLILISSCRDGIGDTAYANLLSSAETPQGALKKIEEGYVLGYHKAAKMASVSARAAVRAYCELPAERLKSLFIKKAESPQRALDEALDGAKKAGITLPKILILPDGSVTVPIVPT